MHGMGADDALASRLKSGDATAFEQLVARFEASLYRFFYCSHRDHHLAQEQTAETFAALVCALPNMRVAD